MNGRRGALALLTAALLLVGFGLWRDRAPDLPVVSGEGPGVAHSAADPVVSASPTPPTRAARPVPVVVARGDGVLHQVSGRSARSGAGPLLRYSVAVEGGLGIPAAGFAAAVERTLADDRSWGHGGRASFVRVDSGPTDFQVSLASPTTTDRLCAPLDTHGDFSCGTGSHAVINAMRWLRGAPSYTGQLGRYREYVVNHEVGHTLGRGHAACPRAGGLAPVMMQQTLGVGGCRPSPWPFP